MRQIALLSALLLAAINVLSADYPGQAVKRLSEYIQVDTVNPPGNEINGARFFAKIFEAAGIQYETAESAPGRGNIWARLKGGDKPALVLLNHMDVVPADASYWDFAPFNGAIEDGYIQGRGALDMKGLGIVQLQGFLALHAGGKKLNRDVIFVATADEEAGGAFGAGWLLENRPEIFKNVGYLLNEGGGGSIQGSDTVFSIEVTQKVPLWLRLVAKGNPGHGSAPQTETAVTRILRAGDRLARTKFPTHLIPAVKVLFESTAQYQEKELAERYADIANAIHDADFMNYLQLTDPRANSLLRNTCSVTRLSGSSKINVVPTEASIELDCRLLPDQDVNEFIKELAIIISDRDVEIEKIMGFSAAVSSADTPLYRVIEDTIETHFSGAKVVPGVTTSFTDSHFFRDIGIVSYGFGPFVTPQIDRGSVHGNNERITVENLERGTRAMIDLLNRFVTAEN